MSIVNNILIIAEHNSKKITDGTLEAIEAGRIISERFECQLSVVVLGEKLVEISQNLVITGADHVFMLEHPSLSQYTSDAYLAALLPFLNQHKPAIALMPSTCLGRDLAPKLSARLKTAFLSDVSGIEFIDGQIIFQRPVYGGRLISAVICKGESPWIITLRPRAFNKTALVQKQAGIEKIDAPLSSLRTIIKGFEQTHKGAGLTEADIIVSGGRGMKGPENFRLLEELANILGGVVGASGAVVDAGWMPHSAQVGQTGKVVSPKLYIACGISGAPQHLAGMSTSKCIVAINKDPEAPIFKMADYGIVGDVFEILPLMIAGLKG